MRITAQEKAQTRERILKAARELFTSQGVEPTTTRHIARAAGIASGTLFNYFQTKEEIAAELVGEALDKARDDFAARRRDGEGLDERLFDFVAAGLRRLRPVRRLVPAVLEL